MIKIEKWVNYLRFKGLKIAESGTLRLVGTLIVLIVVALILRRTLGGGTSLVKNEITERQLLIFIIRSERL